MKNIHVISTDKPSRLYLTTHEYIFEEGYSLSTDECENKHIYITSDEEIKKGDWFYCPTTNIVNQCESDYHSKKLVEPKRFKIILTTDTDLIKDGVQAIDDEFLEWFVNNPSCEDVEVLRYKSNNMHKMNLGYKPIIPKEEPNIVFVTTEQATRIFGAKKLNKMLKNHKKETFNSKRGLKEVQLKEPNTCEHYKEVGCIKDVCNCYTLISKQETLEEAAETYRQFWLENKGLLIKDIFIAGAKWQEEQDKKKFSADEVRDILKVIYKNRQQERSYSEEDMQLMFEFGYRNNNFIESTFKDALNYIEQKKK